MGNPGTERLLTSTSLSNPSAIVTADAGSARRLAVAGDARAFGAALGGMAIGAVLGIAVGVAFGLSRLLASLMRRRRWSRCGRCRRLRWISLALLIYGYGYRMEIAVVAFACFWPVVIITESAVRGSSRVRSKLPALSNSRCSSGSPRSSCRAALPRVFVGLRLAAAISLVVAVTVEITTNLIGLGYGLIVAQEGDRADRVFAFLFWIGFLGWLLNALLLRAQQRWFGKYGNWMETAR